MDSITAETVKEYARESGVTHFEARDDTFWKEMSELTGTELWLDTGDIDAASELWNTSFRGLTTNNTLLNREIQKGIYDNVIRDVAAGLSGLDIREKVMEIAFFLNALHGVKLAARFDARVSVELHTDCAHDIEKTLRYAKRFHEIDPDNFIVKIPLTPEGYIGARRAADQGIPVNFTLGFSARHNYVAACFSHPSYVNVFLGRINSYIQSNGLGKGEPAGEKTTLASRSSIASVPETTTRQIAASMRSGDQVGSLAGVDVFTMPVTVAEEARKTLSGEWAVHTHEDYTAELGSGAEEEAVRLDVLWEISDEIKAYTEQICSTVPGSADEFRTAAREFGTGDMFPDFTEEDLNTIAADGKIPVHEKWASGIQQGNCAVDSLLNLAGLASFTADQNELDRRIEGLIS